MVPGDTVAGLIAIAALAAGAWTNAALAQTADCVVEAATFARAI